MPSACESGKKAGGIIHTVTITRKLPEKGYNIPTEVKIMSGSWESEEDNNWKLIFRKTTCTDYYSDELLQESSYTLKSGLSNCQPDTSKLKGTFLKVKNIRDSTDIICYEVYNISDSILTLRSENNGSFSVFRKIN